MFRHQPTLRERAVLADLMRLLPRFSTLQFGELDARVVPDAQGYRPWLLLRPRQRSLLADPRNSKQTLEDEAELLRNDIQKVGLRVLRAARDANGDRAQMRGADRDLMRELLVRRARQHWLFVAERQQTELPFRDCPRYIEDDVVHRVDRIVHAITEHVVVLRAAQIWTVDASPRVAARKDRLCIEVSAPSPTGPKNGHIALDKFESQLARLKRCILTSAVIGAIEVTDGA